MVFTDTEITYLASQRLGGWRRFNRAEHFR